MGETTRGVIVEVINQRRRDDVRIQEPEGWGKSHKVHGGSPFSVALAASRSLASASMLLKLRSSTGLINTLKNTINPFVTQTEQGNNRNKET